MTPSAPPLLVDLPREPELASEWARDAVPSPVAIADEPEAAEGSWPEFLRELSPSLAPSLLGGIEAHVPGQEAVKAGIQFGRVHIRAKVEAGFAYTEIEEELVNESGAVVEAVASFRAPIGGAVARMALWVDNRWVEAKVVPRKLAAEQYKSIVERRLDPALLEQESNGSVKLRIFPVPAGGSRRVVVSYVQPLERRDGRYQAELGLRLPEGAPAVRELSAEMELVGVAAAQIGLPPTHPASLVEPISNGSRVRWQGTSIRPLDWRITFSAPRDELTTFVAADERFAALRLTPHVPEVAPRREVSVWLIDVSAGQRGSALAVSKAIVSKLLKRLPDGEPFAILACDTACESFPRRGLRRADAESRAEAQGFVAGVDAGGASDVGYALFEALQRTRNHVHAQVVYLGDARPTAGELELSALLERLTPRGESLDLRLVGVGPGLDSAALTEMAARLTGARTIVRDRADGERIARWLTQPMLRSPSLALPSGFELAYPEALPNIVRGDEQLVLARLNRSAQGTLPARLSGLLEGGAGSVPWQTTFGLALPARALRLDTAPRLWAQARARELDARTDEAPETEAVAHSVRYRVLSSHTSLLALERAAPPAARRARGVRLRLASTKVSGRVPPEAIQTTVRRNDGRFRSCYHAGLLKNPQLTGTITTRFVIGRDGTVVSAMDSGSTLADRSVVACVVRAFQGLVFPAPDVPIVVVYPFVVSPGQEKELRMQKTPWVSSEDAPFARLPPARSEPSPATPRANASQLAARVEIELSDGELQLAAGEAYELEHDERRACAHFRAAAALAKRDVTAQYQALRCRARVLNERVSVLADIVRLDLSSPAIDALASSIRSLDDIPAFSP